LAVGVGAAVGEGVGAGILDAVQEQISEMRVPPPHTFAAPIVIALVSIAPESERIPEAAGELEDHPEHVEGDVVPCWFDPVQ
jgi:hypothetical protein